MSDAIGKELLGSVLFRFQMYKTMGDRALAQLEEEDFAWAPGGDSNSIRVILQHLHGNMLSRWKDFLTTDGEKADRNRDGEFLEDDADRADVLAMWETGWDCLFTALAALTVDDLRKTVLIRNHPHTVVEAIVRQLTHYAHHVGQMAYIGKHLKQEGWVTLSIPKGKSAEYLGR